MALISIIIASLGFLQPTLTLNHARKHCEPVTIPLCSGLWYNTTIYPNLLNHRTQDEALPYIRQFWPLVQVACSKDIRYFLCSVYAPPCTIMEIPLPPCRDLCESARDGCESMMLRFGFSWPKFLSCENFPVFGEEICIGTKFQQSWVTEKKKKKYNISKPTTLSFDCQQ